MECESSSNGKLEAGSRKQEAGSRRQEAGGRKQEAGGRRQEAGGRSRRQNVLTECPRVHALVIAECQLPTACCRLLLPPASRSCLVISSYSKETY